MAEQETAPTPAPQQPTPAPQQPKLVDVQLSNQNVALNVIIGFVTLGQQRGVYTIQESAKIWECIRMFQQPQAQPISADVKQPVEQAVEEAIEQAVEEAVQMEVTD